MDSIEDRFLRNGEVELHYVEAGPSEGPLVLLLHGFPSFWYTWKHQIGPLAQAGFHVVAPDLRGYNLSSKPQQVEAYGRDPVLSDVTALIDHCGGRDSKCNLVGHDWGGAIAWAYAQSFPDRLSRLVILNMAYPAAFAKALFTDAKQMQRSWYIFMFQLPSLGENFLAANDFQFLKQVIRDEPAQRQDEGHVRRHLQAFSTPEARTAAVNYYRAFLKHWPGPGSRSAISMPVLLLWGERDHVFQPYLMDLPPRDRVSNAAIVRFPKATHWLMWDEPELVTQHLLGFLTKEIAPQDLTSKL